MSEAKTVQVFKRGSKWFAHLYFNDGTHWAYWQINFRTKARMIENIRCTYDGPIERGIDDEKGLSTNQIWKIYENKTRKLRVLK